MPDTLKITNAKHVCETKLSTPLYQIGDTIRLHITGKLSNLLGDIDLDRDYIIKQIRLNCSSNGSSHYDYELVNNLIFTQNTVTLKESDISPIDKGGTDA